jgi:flagellar biosynthetic protein FlhB
MLLTGTIIILAISGGLVSDLGQSLRLYLEQSHAMPGVPGGFHAVLGGAFSETMKILLLPLLLLMLAAFLGPFLQIGPLFAPEIIKPDLSKISLIMGWKRLFSMRAIMEFFKGLLKISIVGLVSFLLLYPYFSSIDHMVGLPIIIMMEDMKALVLRMLAGTLIVFLVVAVIDLLYQRAEHIKKLRMSRHDLKEEYRQTEGDPQIKAKLRQLRSEKARQRMMANVPTADVVITNPTHYAIALKYDPDTMEAPLCVAKGVDQIALRIREIAKENDVSIVENKPLARALYDAVEIDETIPTEHYRAVAQIISFVFRQKGKIS